MWYAALFAALFAVSIAIGLALGAALSPLPPAPSAPRNVTIIHWTPPPIPPCAIRECRDA